MELPEKDGRKRLKDGRDGKTQFPYRRVIQWAIVLLIFSYLGRMVWENWGQVKEAPFAFRPVPLVLSTLLFSAFYFVQIWAWHLITLRLGISLPLPETLENWFYSQLGKYLPGKVWLLLGRFYFYESKGKPKGLITVALYLETVTLIIAACLLFLASLVFFEEARAVRPGIPLGWLTLILIVIFVSLHPRILETILNGILTRMKREPIALPFSYLDMLWVLLVCVFAWGIGGFGFYLFVDSVYPLALKYSLFVAGAVAFSSTLGLIALFAPSGLGVREGALVYLLGFIMPAPVAVILSILTRIWMTLIEIGLIGVVYLSSLFRKRSRASDERRQDEKD